MQQQKMRVGQNIFLSIEVAASEVGLGAVLSQQHGDSVKLHSFVFISCKLTLIERNYDIGNHKLLTVKVPLEK